MPVWIFCRPVVRDRPKPRSSGPSRTADACGSSSQGGRFGGQSQECERAPIGNRIIDARVVNVSTGEVHALYVRADGFGLVAEGGFVYEVSALGFERFEVSPSKSSAVPVLAGEIRPDILSGATSRAG